MDVIGFLEKASLQEIIEQFRKWDMSDAPEVIGQLVQALEKKFPDSDLRHDIPKLASIILVRKGPKGVNALANVLFQAPGFIYKSSILATLICVANGRSPRGLFFLKEADDLFTPPNKEAIRSAWDASRNVVTLATKDRDALYYLIQTFSQLNFLGLEDDPNGTWFMESFFKILNAGSIRLSTHLIDDFERLVEIKEKEEVYQKFLFQNPVFLDPIAKNVVSKERLGKEYITDFLIERFDQKHFVVEIERPDFHIFKKNGDFSAEFIHGFGQVLDFQRWVVRHHSYAEEHIENIFQPKGLLVIGKTQDLTKEERQKLLMFCYNSQHIEVLGFDDLINRARVLLDSMFTVNGTTYSEG